MNYYAYTPITDGPIVLDLTDCQDWGDLHRRIRKTFGFPAYYGENWDAMWDCIDGLFGVDGPQQIHVKGFSSMPAALQNYAQPMRKIFADLQAQYPLLSIYYL